MNLPLLNKLLIATVLGITGFSASIKAQEFPPKKTITIVVGFAPGGSADNAARVIAKKLSEDLGQNVIVDNKPGAGGNIAHAYTATAPADGSVILFGSIGPLSIAPHFMKLPYDPQKDLAPLTMGVTFPNVLVVTPELGVKNLKEYIALAKKNPGTVTFASTGSGSASHLQGELLNSRADIDTVHVPYKGGSPAMVDLLGGRVSSYYSALATADPYIKNGKLIPIATTGLKRAPTLPNVPTIAESGYPGFDASNWYAFVAPGKTPDSILEKWNKALVAVLNDKATNKQLADHGLTPNPGSREDLQKYIASQSAMWGKIITDRKITAE
ncbi:tripartite tricarboxylate transporter substrate binding protein [Polynucleobacter sp.]|uniref:Bug family tripartite tricarboxylate transporter substrate binding protein n=1 Tax=Polynucleobacter sp. TaxID=2029855 RepID=UPI0026236A97|nr:tripartite tricarboxylate transporter substrate binding protein [Polynucleobacter sp.]MCW1966310.1 tripartite tricarboxylate transporter substrate binding protein [Polynucleobacter sp.]